MFNDIAFFMEKDVCMFLVSDGETPQYKFYLFVISAQKEYFWRKAMGMRIIVGTPDGESLVQQFISSQGFAFSTPIAQCCNISDNNKHNTIIKIGVTKRNTPKQFYSFYLRPAPIDANKPLFLFHLPNIDMRKCFEQPFCLLKGDLLSRKEIVKYLEKDSQSMQYLLGGKTPPLEFIKSWVTVIPPPALHTFKILKHTRTLRKKERTL